MPTGTTHYGSATLARWVVACAIAEAIGMTAAAGAAKVADRVLTSHTPRNVAIAVTCIVLAGLVEGTALGIAQVRTLRIQLPSLPIRWYLTATVLGAGLGWAAGSIPSVTSTDSSASGAPPWPLMILAGAGLGVALGALLGAVQAVTLRRHARRPWLWIGANALAWTPAMAILMLGASLPSASWPVPVVLIWATGTGALAGAVLGLILGLHAPSLTGSRPQDRIVLSALGRGRPRFLCRATMGLRVTGRRSHRQFELPVMFAEAGSDLVVAVGHPQSKNWWRNLPTQPNIDVLHSGRWTPATAEVITRSHPEYSPLRTAYEDRWPRAGLAETDPIVRISRLADRPSDRAFVGPVSVVDDGGKRDG